MSRRPARVAISVAPGERDALTRAAQQAGEPISTYAGRLVRAALAADGAQLDPPPARRAGPDHRPRRARTRASMPATDAIERLRERYPADLRHAPANPHTDTVIAEQLAALAAWRDALDTTEPNPREILAFGHELRTISAWLQDRARRSG